MSMLARSRNPPLPTPPPGVAEDIGRNLLVYGRRLPKAELFARIDAVRAGCVGWAALEWCPGGVRTGPHLVARNISTCPSLTFCHSTCPSPALPQVDADTVKAVANRFILDQDIAIAAMGDTQMLPGERFRRQVGRCMGLGACLYRRVILEDRGQSVCWGESIRSEKPRRPPLHPVQTTTGCGAAPTG